MRTHIDDLLMKPDAEQQEFINSHKSCGHHGDQTIGWSVSDQGVERTATCLVCQDSDSQLIATATHPEWPAIKAEAVELCRSFNDLKALIRAELEGDTETAQAIRARARRQLEQERIVH